MKHPKHLRHRTISSDIRRIAYLVAAIVLIAAVASASGLLPAKTEPAKPRIQQSAVATAPAPAPAPSAVATPPPAPAPAPAPKPKPSLPVEARAVWVTRWNYRTPADVERIMRQLAGANMNIVYFQVRGAGDAYYRSAYEPWAASLTGRIGRNPGWDPLSTAVKSAHKHGLKLHAWINVYPVAYANQPAPPKTKPLSPYHRKNWRIAGAGGRLAGPVDSYIWASPGNPSYQAHVEKIATDIAKRYDIDGLHMDRVRYPGPAYSYDRASRSAYAAADRAYRKSHPGGRLSYSSWQTGQVTRLVARIHDGVKSVRPEAQISAATWGIPTDRWGWGSSDGKRDFYQDSEGWMKKGIVDFLAPMTYWKIRGDKAKWGVLVSDFVRNRGEAQVYPGIAAYKFAKSDWREIVYEVKLGRRLGAKGFSFFDYSSLAGRWEDLRRLFPKKAAVPGSSSEDAARESGAVPGQGQSE